MGKALDAAYTQLRIIDIAEACDPPRSIRWAKTARDGEGLCFSPFPELHTNGDKEASFSITPGKGGQCWANFAGKQQYAQSGGLLAFAKECKPAATEGELRDWLVEIAGTRDLDADFKKGQSDRPTATEQANKRKAKAVAKRVQLQTDRRKALAGPPQKAGEVVAWPEFVAARYDEGARYGLAANHNFSDTSGRLSKARGWPIEWCDELLETGGVARPLLPWAWTDNQRGWAFKCEAPKSQSGAIELVTTGYHQRFETESGKQWVFVPYSIFKDKAKSKFQKQLSKFRETGGYEPLEAVPYVIGDLSRPALVIITEGQWDAITIYGSLGGFDDGDPIPVCVFGIRGVKNSSLLLKYWGKWFRGLRGSGVLKSILVIADGDKAGLGLITATKPADHMAVPSFRERLLASVPGCRVVCSNINAGESGKDFNDFYKAERPTVGAMWEMVNELGLLKNGDA